VLRLFAGALAASLFAGFTLFQGVTWWPWIIWVVVFLPWGGWKPLTATMTLSTASMATLAALVIVQAVAAVARIEMEPVMSAYQMYADSYSSPADYEARRRRKYQHVEVMIGGTRVELSGGASDNVIAASEAHLSGVTAEADAVATVNALCATGNPYPASIGVRIARTRLQWDSPLVGRTTTESKATLPCPNRAVR